MGCLFCLLIYKHFIQCTVFALTVHLLLVSHVALWLWNDALFDCQPGEEEIRHGKEYLSSNDYWVCLKN